MGEFKMSESEIRHGRHCVFQMHVHLVFVTKYRRKVFTKEILADLRDTFDSVCQDFESELVEFDGTMERSTVVTIVLCSQLWRCTAIDH